MSKAKQYDEPTIDKWCVGGSTNSIPNCYLCSCISQSIQVVRWPKTSKYLTPNSEQVKHKGIKQVCK